MIPRLLHLTIRQPRIAELVHPQGAPLRIILARNPDYPITSDLTVRADIKTQRTGSSNSLAGTSITIPANSTGPWTINLPAGALNQTVTGEFKRYWLVVSANGEALAGCILTLTANNVEGLAPPPPVDPIYLTQAAADALYADADDLANLEARVDALEAAGPGGGGPADAVRYGVAQTLTDPQKAQARTNIGLGSLATKNTVAAGDLANGSVTTDKILDAAVVESKLAAGSVTETKLGSASVNASKLAADVLALLDALAPKLSPALTGTPTAPTATPGTASTQIATTQFVAAAIASLINGSPGALDTLNELAAALGSDPNFAATVNNALSARLVRANNLSDLTDVATARTNLGLGALALLSQVTGAQLSTALAALVNGALQAASNLSDLEDAAQARDSLGLGSAATLDTAAGGGGSADTGKIPTFGTDGALKANSFQVIRDGTHFSAVEFWNLTDPLDPGVAGLDADVAPGNGGTWLLRDPANATQTIAFLTDLQSKADLDGGGKVFRTQLPVPLASELGGVMRNAGTAGQFINGINADGSLSYGTPSGSGGGSGPGGLDGEVQYRVNSTTFGGATGFTLASGALQRIDAVETALGTTPAPDTICARNATAATNGFPQASPTIVLKANVWHSGFGTQVAEVRQWVSPTQNGTTPWLDHVFESRIGGGAWSAMARIRRLSGVNALLVPGTGASWQPQLVCGTNAGFYSTNGTSDLWLAFGGTAAFSWTSAGVFTLGSTTIRTGGAGILALGAAPSASPVAQSLIGQSGSGTNIGGGSLTIGGGQSTGNAVGGDTIIQGAPAGSAGAGINAYQTIARFRASDRTLVMSGTLVLGEFTFATLPVTAGTGAVRGATAFVVDASTTTFRDIVAGGGSAGVPVHHDGTDWRVG